jgi:nucleotide-binding universal stress UspA family protein
MATHVIVSYDDSPLDRDALALGAFLSDADATLTMAYVRHAAESRADREQLAATAAAQLLAHGAARLEASSVERRVIVSPSTPAGLSALAVEMTADVIVFGSEYRTPQGHIGLSRSAQTLLENGPAAVALAPAGYDAVDGPTGHGRDVRRIGILPGSADEASIETAHALAERHAGGRGTCDGEFQRRPCDRGRPCAGNRHRPRHRARLPHARRRLSHPCGLL